MSKSRSCSSDSYTSADTSAEVIREDETEEEDEEDEQEEVDDYSPGGYHPVKIGEILRSRYMVIRKLGWGHFSTVWLCTDRYSKKYVAVKIVKSEDSYSDSACDEISLLRSIHGADRMDLKREKIVQLFDEFKIGGIHGNHVCMVMEVVGSDNLLKVITGSDYKGVPIMNVRSIIRQVLEALDYLHTKCRIIHTDLKPENVLIQCDPDDVKYLHDEAKHWDKWKIPYPPNAVCNLPEDFYTRPKKREPGELSKNMRKKLKKKLKKLTTQASNCDDQTINGAAGDINEPLIINGNEEDKPPCPSSFKPNPAVEVCTINVKLADLGNACPIDRHYTDDIQTRQYRSPEVILGAGYTTSADIWSVACMAFELATGDFLFDPHSGKDYSRDEDHLALMHELLGKIPKGLIKAGKYSKDFFNGKGTTRSIREMCSWSLESVLMEKYRWDELSAKEFSEFLYPMLKYDKYLRATSAKCLQHSWLSSQREVIYTSKENQD